MFNHQLIDRIISSLKLRRILPKDVKISRNAHIDRNCSFEGMNAIYNNVFFRGSLGLGSYIGEKSRIAADIGKFTSIAPRVITVSGTHPYSEPYVTTSPCFFSTDTQFRAGKSFANIEVFKKRMKIDLSRNIDVKIGNDCWIGEEAMLIGGISIGDGAVILARAVVTKDVPCYAIVGGVPAKIIGYRYDLETVQFLTKTQWWNNNKKWFEDNWMLLNNIDKFKEYYHSIIKE